MKIEFNKKIETLKKRKSEIKIEMENSATQTKSSKESFTNELDQRKERLLGLNDKVEDLILSVKKILH